MLSASACVAVTLIADGSMSFAMVLAAAVNCGFTRSTVSPVVVIAADARIVYATDPLGLIPAMVNTTEGVAVTAVTLMKNKPEALSHPIVAELVAVLAALAKISWCSLLIGFPNKKRGAEAPLFSVAR